MLSEGVHVYLNGDDVTADCLEASPLVGWVKLRLRDPDGNPIVSQAPTRTGELLHAWVMRYGEVVVETEYGERL